jgi:UDP-GlcNAc3NAcA epimerase
MKKILSIVGVRPQFVKAAMVCAAVDRHNAQALPRNRVHHQLLNTGQHYDFEMAEVFFQQLPLPAPDFNLGVGSGTHGAQTAAMLTGIENLLLQQQPDCVMVYGDTNSTLAGALAAVKLHIPVVHVEAGLRSFNRAMPEEINRIATDHVSDFLFCPTQSAVEQLAREGIVRNAQFTGDVMLDATQAFVPLAMQRSLVLQELGVAEKRFILVTIHRAENTDSMDRLRQLVESLCRLERPTVFAMHPRLRHKLNQEREYAGLNRTLKAARHVRIVNPLPYLDMLNLESNAQLVMTDSGGVQKEAYFVGTPCLTLRDETEWNETLADGWNRLVGSSPEKILPLVESLWSNNGATPAGKPALAVFGDGRASDRMVKILQETEPIAHA